MKKLFFGALVSLAALGTAAPSSYAWHTFGLITHHGCGCCNGCNFCVRPYNAFSPVCSGNVTFDGIYPFCTGGFNGLNYNGIGCGTDGGCGPVGLLPCDPTSGTAQVLPNGPAPMPAAMPLGPVQPTGYQPILYPGYNQGIAPMQPMGGLPYYRNSNLPANGQ